MNTFELNNQVRLSISQALLLLYRYLTDIYALGDLSFVQFFGGVVRGKKRSLDGCRVLTISGNGIGELEKTLCLQWNLDQLETMAVSPGQMRVFRLLKDAASKEVTEFFKWAQSCLSDYANLRGLLSSPGLVAYWQQQCNLWQTTELRGRVRLFGGSPWDMPTTETYDAMLLSHAQNLFTDNNAKDLFSHLKPGGWLAALMPVIFHPDGLDKRMPTRFSDIPVIEEAKQRMREEARRLGYELDVGQPVHINWALAEEDTVHIVSFSIASPLRSLLIGELLIQSLASELPEATMLGLLESALSEIPARAGAGTEALLILIAEKEVL